MHCEHSLRMIRNCAYLTLSYAYIHASLCKLSHEISDTVRYLATDCNWPSYTLELTATPQRIAVSCYMYAGLKTRIFVWKIINLKWHCLKNICIAYVSAGGASKIFGYAYCPINYYAFWCSSRWRSVGPDYNRDYQLVELCSKMADLVNKWFWNEWIGNKQFYMSEYFHLQPWSKCIRCKYHFTEK